MQIEFGSSSRLRRLSILLLGFLLIGAAKAEDPPVPACVVPAGIKQQVEPRLPKADRWQPAGNVRGTNTLYFTEGDAFWARDEARESLRRAGLSVFRFPGGEVAENYDWQRNELINPRQWPGEPDDEAGRQARTDYREFLAHARAAGASDLFFVANVDTHVREGGNLEEALTRGAERAAVWVSKLREQGVSGVWWEIGNEPYLATGFPLTIGEYATAVRIYADKMKAADPSIRIGAAGPHAIREPGFADTMSPALMAKMRAGRGDLKEFCRRDDMRECREKLVREARKLASGEAWWPTLLRETGNRIDFAVAHHYAVSDLESGDLLQLGRSLRKFRGELEKLAGRPIPLAVTEWNLAGRTAARQYDDADHLLDVAIKYGNLLAAGVGHAHYWPTTSAGAMFIPLLEADGRPRPAARVFDLYDAVRPGDLVTQFAAGKGVYVLAYRQAASGRSGYLLVNARRDGLLARLPPLDAESGSVGGQLVALPAANGVPASPCLLTRTDKRFSVAVPARAVVHLGLPARE